MTKGGDNPRALAFEILLKWDREKVNSDSLISAVLDNYAYLSREDRRLIKRLSEGAIENAILLDYIIDQNSKIKTQKLKPPVRAILRLGVYQLYFMDSVPAHAAINESVRLAKLKHLGELRGYINAVLRSIDRERADLDAIRDVSVRYSCPAWIVDLLKDEYGEERAEKIVQSYLGARKLYIRVNTTKTTRQELAGRLKDKGLEVSGVEGFDEALELGGVDMLTYLPEFQQGLFSVQDISSMSIGHLIEPFQGMRVLDLCASPGGKSTHAAERLYASGSVEARDVSERKLSLIRENVERLGLENVDMRLGDATVRDEGSIASFDVVLADLPCSGLGVIGRKNEIKYRLKPEDIGSLVGLQRDILGSSHVYVKPGGLLVYSVCTITREETTGQREYIEGLGFELKAERLFLPGENDFDGLYYAVFIRR